MLPLATIICGFVVLTGYLFFRLIPDNQEQALRAAMPATNQQRRRMDRINDGRCPNCGSKEITRRRRSLEGQRSTTDSGNVILENPMIRSNHGNGHGGKSMVEEWSCPHCERIVHEVRFRTS